MLRWHASMYKVLTQDKKEAKLWFTEKFFVPLRSKNVMWNNSGY